MDWESLSRMDFERVDHDRFPALRLAYRVIEAGGSAGAIFNGANEAAVAAFLERRIPFGRITELFQHALGAVAVTPLHTMQDVLAADRASREFVKRRLSEAPDAMAATPAR